MDSRFGGRTGKFVLGSVVLAGVLAGTGCGKKAAGDVERIQASGNFRVAIVDTDSSYTSLEENEPVGLEPDLAEYIGQMLGVNVKYQVCEKKEALAAVADGEADVAMGCINNSGSLSGEYRVSAVYGKGYFYAVTKAGDYVLTVGALENSSVGTDAGLDEETKSSLHQAEGIRLVDYSSLSDAARDVKDGAIRAYICYENQAKQLLEDEELQVQNVSNLDPEEFVIVTSRANETLAGGMDTLIRQFLEAE